MVAKQVADLITLARGALGLYLIWLGNSRGAQGLPLAVVTMILAWTGDSLDGPLARRSRRRYHTWIGDNDLLVDMLVATGLLAYLTFAGYLPWPGSLGYLILWGLFFHRWGVLREPGELYQAPVYALFIYYALRDAPWAGRWLIVWILAALILTWPKFPQVIVPEFLRGMRHSWHTIIRRGKPLNSNERNHF